MDFVDPETRKSEIRNKAQVTFWVMPQIKRQGAIRHRFKRIKEC